MDRSGLADAPAAHRGLKGCWLAGLLSAALLPACNAMLPPEGVNLLNEGHAAYGKGEYGTTVARMDQFLLTYSASPAAGEAFYLRGLARAQLRQRPQARQDLELAVKNSHRTDLAPLAQVALGNLLFESWQWSEAAKHYAEAVEKLPDTGPKDIVLYRLGVSFERQGKWDKGKAWLSQVIQKFPDSPVEPAARRHFAANAFTIQCGAYDDFARASEQANRLKAHGLAARLAQDPRRRFHLVQVGSYPNYEAARIGLGQVLGFVPEAIIVP